MQPWDVENALKSMVVFADTREQDTLRARKRYKAIGVPVFRECLETGDYSAKCDLIDLRGVVVIERKMDLNELSACFCQQRSRFEREFERAKRNGIKVYLLIENASIDDVYMHNYRTLMHENAMVANIWAWCARYNCQIVFCSAMNSGKVIHDILYRELKERLEKMPDEEGENGQ